MTDFNALPLVLFSLPSQTQFPLFPSFHFLLLKYLLHTYKCNPTSHFLEAPMSRALAKALDTVESFLKIPL